MSSKRQVAQRFRVRCSGHMHEILVMDNGRIVLKDHSSKSHDTVMRELGMRIRCRDVLEKWVRGPVGGVKKAEIPQSMRELWDKRVKMNQERQEHRYCVDPLGLGLEARVDGKVRRALYTTWAQCEDYYTGAQGHEINFSVMLESGASPRIAGKYIRPRVSSDRVREQDGSKWGSWRTYTYIGAPRVVALRWYLNVFKRGLAVDEQGRFVLHIDSKGYRIVIDQRKGRVVQQSALVDPDGQVVHWKPSLEVE